MDVLALGNHGSGRIADREDHGIRRYGEALAVLGDMVEMYVTDKISALVIKRPVDLVDEEIVGVILRTEY